MRVNSTSTEFSGVGSSSCGRFHQKANRLGSSTVSTTMAVPLFSPKSRYPLPPGFSSSSTRSANHRLICSGWVIVRHTTSSGASISTSRSILKLVTSAPTSRVDVQPMVALHQGYATDSCR